MSIVKNYVETQLAQVRVALVATEAEDKATEAEHMAIEAVYNASKAKRSVVTAKLIAAQKAVKETEAVLANVTNILSKDVCETAQTHSPVGSPVGGWWSGNLLLPLPRDTPAVALADTPTVAPPEVKVSDTPAVAPPEVKVSDTPEEVGWQEVKPKVIKPKVIKPKRVTNFTLVFGSYLTDIGKSPTTPEEAKPMCEQVLKRDFGEVNINIEKVVKSYKYDGWTVMFTMNEEFRQTYPFEVKNRKMEWYLPCGRTFSEWEGLNTY